MTLQNLLPPRVQLSTSESELAAQREKTAALLQANKLAAARILQDTLARLESSKPISSSVIKKIWI
jgi:hypothetical protein